MKLVFVCLFKNYEQKNITVSRGLDTSVFGLKVSYSSARPKSEYI